MNRYVICMDFHGNEKLIAVNSVRAVHREDREERASIIEDCNGRMYECYHELLACPKFRDCIVEV